MRRVEATCVWAYLFGVQRDVRSILGVHQKADLGASRQSVESGKSIQAAGLVGLHESRQDGQYAYLQQFGCGPCDRTQCL